MQTVKNLVLVLALIWLLFKVGPALLFWGLVLASAMPDVALFGALAVVVFVVLWVGTRGPRGPRPPT